MINLYDSKFSILELSKENALTYVLKIFAEIYYEEYWSVLISQ